MVCHGNNALLESESTMVEYPLPVFAGEFCNIESPETDASYFPRIKKRDDAVNSSK